MTLWRRYEEVFSYLFFGVCTTLVNFIVYTLCTRTFLPLMLPASLTLFGKTLAGEALLAAAGNAIAWFCAVAFAYATNRRFVFRSCTRGCAMLREICSFYACRITSGVIEILAPSLLIGLLEWNDLVAKAIISVLIILLNYLLSKLITFRKKAAPAKEKPQSSPQE